MLDLTCTWTPLCSSITTKIGRTMASSTQDSREPQIAPQTQRLQIYPTTNNGVSPFWRGTSLSLSHALPCNSQKKKYIDFWFVFVEKYEREAKRYWDVFYKRHKDKVSFPTSNFSFNK